MRPIPNFPGYFADKQGNIWSGWEKGGRRRINTNIPTRKLKPIRMNTGYLAVCLSKNKKAHMKSIHRLILEAFVGPCPARMETRHKDGDRQNNTLSNLKWGTSKDNKQDMIEHNTSNRGEGHPKAKLNNWKVRVIRQLLKKKHLTQEQIAEIFGITQENISMIKTGKRWSYI